MVKTDGIVARWLLEADMTVSERFGKLGRSKRRKQVARTSRTPPSSQSGVPMLAYFNSTTLYFVDKYDYTWIGRYEEGNV